MVLRFLFTGKIGDSGGGGRRWWSCVAVTVAR